MFEAELVKHNTPDAQFRLESGLAQAYEEDGRILEAIMHLKRAVKTPLPPKHLLPRVYLRLALLAKQIGDHGRLQQAAASAIAADQIACGRSGVAREARKLIVSETALHP